MTGLALKRKLRLVVLLWWTLHSPSKSSPPSRPRSRPERAPPPPATRTSRRRSVVLCTPSPSAGSSLSSCPGRLTDSAYAATDPPASAELQRVGSVVTPSRRAPGGDPPTEVDVDAAELVAQKYYNIHQFFERENRLLKRMNQF